MPSKYTVTTKKKGQGSVLSAVARQPICDGLEERTFFAATPAPMTMGMPHMHPAAMVELVPVVIETGTYGRPQFGLELVVIREMPIFGPPPISISFPGSGGTIVAPPAGNGSPGGVDSNGGDGQTSGSSPASSSHNSVTPGQTSVLQAMQLNAAAVSPMSTKDSAVVVASGQKLNVTASASDGASNADAATAANILKLDSTPEPGISTATVAAETNDLPPQWPATAMNNFPAAFPPSLGSWMQSAARPLEQAMTAITALTSLTLPASVGNVFGTASPGEFLKAAPPALASALSNLGALVTHVSAPVVDGNFAWESAAVVGVGLAVAVYGYNKADQRRNAAAAQRQELARKEWDMQSLEER